MLSEFPRGTRVQRRFFASRNRLLSGLSPLTLVIEAGPRSGTLLTVEHALDQGREVHALPGSIFSPESRGPNQLLAEGATVYLGVPQLLAGLQLGREGVAATQALERLRATPLRAAPDAELAPVADELQASVLDILGQRAMNLVELDEATGLGRVRLIGLVEVLERRGLIHMRRGRYQRRAAL